MPGALQANDSRAEVAGHSALFSRALGPKAVSEPALPSGSMKIWKITPSDAFNAPAGLVRDSLGAPYFSTEEIDLRQGRPSDAGGLSAGGGSPGRRSVQRAIGKLHTDGHVTLFNKRFSVSPRK
jgi:hypothetical protein